MTQCSFLAPLTEDQLSDMLDGIADPSVIEHLDKCVYCSARLEEARRIEGRLHRQLSHWDAPSADELADYVLGLLDDQAREQIENYLRISPSMREEVENLRGFLNDEALSVKPVSPRPEADARAWHSIPRLEEIIATFIPRTLQPALRGEGGLARGELTAEGRGVTIFVEYVVEGDICTVTGQVMASDPNVWSGALAQMLAEANPVGITMLDPAGEFKFTNIPPGTYDLKNHIRAQTSSCRS